MQGRVGVVVPAAGVGARMGGAHKALLELAGEPVLAHALRPFLAESRVVRIAVAVPPEVSIDSPAWLTAMDARIVVVRGGATRSQSVRAGLAALPGDLEAIAVHDAARPLVTSSVVAACIDLALEGCGAVAGCPSVDTLKRVNAECRVVETEDRSVIWQAQTPQVFPAAILRAAYASPFAEATDDAAHVERTQPGVAVRMVDAGTLNLKVTRPEDLVLAEAVLRARAAAWSP